MERTAIRTVSAPEAIGPYSQAIRVGDLVFTSGQIALDPATGKMIDGDVVAQTRQVMNNLAAVLGAAGLGFGDVVKSTIFLVDMDDFAAVNQIYGERFAGERFIGTIPARSTVAVARLPRDARVEIEMIAVRTS